MKSFISTFIITIILSIFSQIGWGQVTTIDFETVGDGYTPSGTEGSGSIDVFNRSNPDIGGNSTFLWACEDITLANPSITLDQIDITGSTSFTFSIDMLTPNTNDWDIADELLITYSIDGGTYQNLLWIQSIPDGDNFNAPAALDLAFDGDGDTGQELPALVDDFGAGVGSTFQNFSSVSIALSVNSTLNIILQYNGLDATAEGIYIDNIVITEIGGSTNDTDSEASVPTGGQQAGGTISSLADTDPEAVDVFKFDIDDLGTADGLVTSVTNIRLKPHSSNTADWTDHIQGVKLNAGGAVTIGTPTITDTYIDIPISPGNLDITDGASSTITMSVYLNTANILDGAVLSFMIDADAHGFNSDASGSAFATTFTGGDFNSNDFTITVAATELQFVQEPTDTEVNVAMSPDPTVKACDENGNIDTDHITSITLSSDGTLTGDPVTGSLSSGLATFSGLTHTVEETGRTLTASSGALTDGTSTNFDITAALLSGCASDLIISEVDENGNDKYIEIANYTGGSVSLVDYDIVIYFNGNTTSGAPIDLDDASSIADGDVWVLANTNLSITADQTSGSFSPNGNDVIALRKSSTNLDVFGVIGTGTNWYDNQQYIRNTDIFDPTTGYAASEWTISAYGGGDPGTLGSHTMTCLNIDTDSEASIPTGGQQAGSVISSLADTDPEAVDVFKFDIEDLGTSDGLVTSVTNIRILPHSTNTADWTDHIQGLKLDAGTNITTSNPTITDTYIDIPITSGDLDIEDGNDSTITMSVYLNTANIIDGAVLSFMIDADAHGFTTDASGSDFASAFSGGDITSNDFTVSVVATELNFVQGPIDTEINEIMNPVVTVEAIDVNGNRDLDNSDLISLSSSGTMNSVSDISLSNGFGTFGDIVHTVSGTDLSLTASTPSLTDIISELFDIIIINYVAGDYRTLQSGSWLSNTGDGVWEYFNGSIWEDPHNSPTYSTSATLYIRYGHTITSGGSFANSVNINISGGEFIVDHPSTAATVVVRSGNFTVNPSTAFVIPASGSVTVNEDGIFNLNSSTVTITSGAVFTIESGGLLKLNNSGLRNNNTFWNGTEDFQDGSIVELLDWDWTASATYRSLINIDTDISDNTQGYKFGNFIFNANPGNDWTMIGGGIGIIELCYNDFIVNNSSANYISGASNSTGSNGYIINGNLIVNSGNFSFGSSYSPDPFDHQFTINGNFEYNGTGDFKIHRNGTSTADNLFGRLTINGNMTVNSAASFTQDLPTDLNDLMYIDFAGTTTQEINIGCTVNTVSFNVKPDAEVQLVSNNLILNSSVGATNAFTVETGGTLHFGWDDDGTTPLLITSAASPSGTNEFTSEQGSILKITHTEGISTTALTGNVQISPSNISYNQTAIFHYLGKSNQETGNGITTGSVGKVIIVELFDNSVELALTNSTGISEAVTVHTNGGHLDVRSGILRETETDYLNGSGTITMTGGRYVIHRSSQDASDYIPRLIGSTFPYNLTGGIIELSSAVAYDGSTVFGQILRGARNYYSLTFSGGGDKRISSALTDIDGTVTIEDDNTELDVENNEFSGTGNLSMTDNSLFRMSSLNNTLPELTGIYSLTGGTVELYGSNATQTDSLRGTDGSKGTITYNNVEINALAENTAFDQANVVASASFNVAGIMNVNSPACFKIGALYVIGGAGTFDLKSGATLKYGSADGIVSAAASGNIQTTTRIFDVGASFGLCGTVAPQSTGDALPANINNFYLEKTDTEDNVLLNTVQINGDMILREGILQIDADMSTPVLCDNGDGNGDVSIESGAVLEVLVNKAITVEGTITNTPGASGIVIRSDATGTGSLIHSVVGIPATVERFITGDQWHYMFAPLSSTASSIYTLEGSTTNQNYYTYDETTMDYWNATTIYETSGWTSGPADLPVDKGFIFNRIGLADKVYSQTGGNMFEGQKDFSVTYTTNTGTIGNGCINNWAFYDGWNLVGNPYTSGIDWDAVSKTNIESGVYCYDGSNYQYYINGGGSSLWDVGITVNNASQYIPAGQGFMVKATTSGTFSLQNDDRVHSSQGFWKNNNEPVPNLIRLQIEMDDYTDETVIRTLPDESMVTIDHDGNYDAYKFFAWDNSKPQLYSKDAGNSMYYSINSLPEFNEIMTIPLGIYIGEPGDYLLNMTENSFENIHIWLEDNFLETETNLLNDPDYEFTYSAENNDNRFFIHFGKNHEPLINFEIPDQEVFVNEYLSFRIPSNVFYDIDFDDELSLSASLASGDDLPDWLTFDSDLEQFYGTPEDVQSLNINVKATDVFGEFVSDEFILTVKSVVSVGDISNYINIYPNPTNGLIKIEFNKLINSGFIKIKDARGQVVFLQNIKAYTSDFDLSNLSKGVYFIEIKTDKININKKIVLN